MDSNIDGVTYIPGFYEQNNLAKIQQELEPYWNYHNFFKRHFWHYVPGVSATIDNIIITIQNHLQCRIRGAFINLYKNGNEYAPYHKDKYDSTVVSLSIGGTRDFFFKHDTTGVRHKWTLNDGDLFMFENSVNEKYKHSVPQRKKMNHPRICITIFVQPLQ